MGPEMNKLPEYLNILSKTFYLNGDISKGHSFKEDKIFLRQALEKKENLSNSWMKLIEALKKNGSVRIRDFSEFGGRHSFNCVYIFRQKQTESAGLIFSISIPFDAVGFYFYKFIKDSTDNYKKVGSYSPLDEEMKTIEHNIASCSSKYFTEFEVFDSDIATYKIRTVEIDRAVYHKIDLWEAIFTTNLNIAM